MLRWSLLSILLTVSASAAEIFLNVSDNRAEYPDQKVPLYSKLEVTFKLSREYGNPFAPYPINPKAASTELVDANGVQASLDGVTITGVFEQKGGATIRTPAFWDGDVWRIRMCPTQVGEWSYSIELEDKLGKEQSKLTVFQVSASNAPGFVRVHKSFFQFDNGSAFIPFGNNLTKTTDSEKIELWGKRLHEHGMNAQRFWLHPHYTALEWNASGPNGASYSPETVGLGRYSLPNARSMDKIVATAEKNDLYGILCQDDTICYTNSPHEDPKIGWEYNPYRSICRDGIEFFTNEQAKRYYKRRLRYLVARWAYSTHVFSWELQNEVDWPYLDVVRSDKGKSWKLQDLVSWHEEMANYLRAVDPYRRPVSANTASKCLGWGSAFKDGGYDDRLFLLHQKMDFVNHHLYNADIELIDKTAAKFKGFVPGKPLILGEWGLDAVFKKGEASIQAPIGLHNAIWMSLMTTGSAPFHWYWDKYAEIGGLQHYQAAKDFFSGENFVRDDLQTVKLTMKSESLRAYGWVGKKKVLVWVWDTRSRQDKPQTDLVKDEVLVLKDFPAGMYRVDAFDPWKSEWLKPSTIKHTGGELSVKLPDFSRDVALKVVLEEKK